MSSWVKWFDNVTWPKAALFGGALLLVVGIVHRPTAEWVLGWIRDLAEILANAVGNLGG